MLAGVAIQPFQLHARTNEWEAPSGDCPVGTGIPPRRDYAAVQAALCYQWNQGSVEGHVNRLKTIKRQMYGRAGFALLRRRVHADQASAA